MNEKLIRIVLILGVLGITSFALASCGSCLDPFNHLSDCPSLAWPF